MRNSEIAVHPIAGGIGAEIHNVDVGQDLDERTIGDIRKALLDHCVIFFRDQTLTAEQHKAFTRRIRGDFHSSQLSGHASRSRDRRHYARARRHAHRR